MAKTQVSYGNLGYCPSLHLLLLQSGAAIKDYLILFNGIEYCDEFRALQNKMLLQSVAAIEIYLTVALNIELLL